MASGTTRYKYETDAGNFFFARTDNSEDLATIRGTSRQVLLQNQSRLNSQKGQKP